MNPSDQSPKLHKAGLRKLTYFPFEVLRKVAPTRKPVVPAVDSPQKSLIAKIFKKAKAEDRRDNDSAEPPQ